MAFQHHQSSIDQFLFEDTNINLYFAILTVDFQPVIQTSIKAFWNPFRTYNYALQTHK